MSSARFPLGLSIAVDHHRKTWRLLDRATNQAFLLESALDELRPQSTLTGRKATHEFLKSFLTSVYWALITLLINNFMKFDHSDYGPTFEDKYLGVIAGVQRVATEIVRRTVEHQTEESLSSYLFEKLLDDSEIRSLFKSTNAESFLAASLDEARFFNLRHFYESRSPDKSVPLFDGFELRLAKYTVRRRGLTLRDNGPLIARLRDEIRARFSAWERGLNDQLIQDSGHSDTHSCHKDNKPHTGRHKGKDRSKSGRIWRHLTLSRDETSASDFLRERILILFFKESLSLRENAELDDSNVKHIRGSNLAQKQQQPHSFLTYPRRERLSEEASSQQKAWQLPRNLKTLHEVVQIEDMDSRAQEGSTPGTEGGVNGSKELYPESPAMSLDLEHRPLETFGEDNGKWKIIHLLPNSIGQPPSAYLDKPVWAPSFGRGNFRLKAFLPVTNVYEYAQQSGLDFTIARSYSEPSLEPELRRVLAKQQPPPDPINHHEQIELRSQRMIEAMQEFYRIHFELLKTFPDFEIRAPITAPYLFWYTCRDIADLQRLSHPNQELMATLTSWITRNYEQRYTEVKSHLEKGVVTLRTMPFLLRPGDVLVWKEKGKTKAAITSSVISQISPPILYWDASRMVEFGDNIDRGKKRGEFSTKWRVDVWSYKFNGEFLRDRRCKEIKFKASSLEQEVDISKLGVYPLRFADEETRHQLETRGKTFWTCRHRNLVSHKGDEGLFANGERFVVDFQVYKQLHSDSQKFKFMYEEDGESSDSTEYSDDSDDSDDGDEDENARKISAEAMASDTPPSDPYIYLFPDTVPGYNLRSKKWVDLEVDFITDVEWNKKSFDNLVIDAKAKEMIQALVSHQIESEKGTDLIHRKGNGLIILLHGGPGTGKTFTAESVAEIAQKPLFCVTCGDIGTKPEQVEKYLDSVLHLGKIWGCVVLIDEAEVFLEQRSLDNLERNALVSVFLRVLEYYEGILILTTNRVGTFDEAFKSRILLSLHYEKLTIGQRRKIWRGFINHLEDTHAPGGGKNGGRERTNGASSAAGTTLLRRGSQNDMPDIDYQEILDSLDELASHELNGRQIRNIITTARQLAKFRKKTLDYGLLQEVISLSGKFDEYFSKLNENQSDEQIARSDGLR